MAILGYFIEEESLKDSSIDKVSQEEEPKESLYLRVPLEYADAPSEAWESIIHLYIEKKKELKHIKEDIDIFEADPALLTTEQKLNIIIKKNLIEEFAMFIVAQATVMCSIAKDIEDDGVAITET